MALKEHLRKTLPRAILIKYTCTNNMYIHIFSNKGKSNVDISQAAHFWKGDRFLTAQPEAKRKRKICLFPSGEPVKIS